MIPHNACHQDVVRQQRKPRAVVVSHIVCAAYQKGKVSERFSNLLDFKDEIHARGGFIVEVTTGRQSNKQDDWKLMKEDARRCLGRISQGTKSATNGQRGSPSYGFDKVATITLIGIRDSKKFINWKQREAAIVEAGIKPPPKRTWMLTKLDNYARAHGWLK